MWHLLIVVGTAVLALAVDVAVLVGWLATAVAAHRGVRP
jgi:hypothetical protein